VWETEKRWFPFPGEKKDKKESYVKKPWKAVEARPWPMVEKERVATAERRCKVIRKPIQ